MQRGGDLCPRAACFDFPGFFQRAVNIEHSEFCALCSSWKGKSQWEISHELQRYRILDCRDPDAGNLEMAISKSAARSRPARRKRGSACWPSAGFSCGSTAPSGWRGARRLLEFPRFSTVSLHIPNRPNSAAFRRRLRGRLFRACRRQKLLFQPVKFSGIDDMAFAAPLLVDAPFRDDGPGPI